MSRKTGYPAAASEKEWELCLAAVSADIPTGKLNGKIYSMQASSFAGWTLLLVQPAETSANLVRPLLLVLLMMGISLLVVGGVCVAVVSWQVTRPLRALSENIKKVSPKNLTLHIPNNAGRDELAEINTAFDDMFICLQNSMDEVVRLKAHEVQAHMVALQSQMNPHFLFNVISGIKAMSYEHNYREIDRICDYMANTLRYISSYSDTLVPIGSELENAEDYLQIMRFRFGVRLSYDISADANILVTPTLIPKLCVQPLLENCFQHAFRDKLCPWSIHVAACIDGEQWRVTVTDNGAGIAPETVEQLLKRADEFLKQPSERLMEMTPGGMGLVNTIVRLRLRYKQDMIFEVTYPPEGGTCITIGGLVQHDTNSSD